MTNGPSMPPNIHSGLPGDRLSKNFCMGCDQLAGGEIDLRLTSSVATAIKIGVAVIILDERRIVVVLRGERAIHQLIWSRYAVCAKQPNVMRLHAFGVLRRDLSAVDR